ncbi:MAG: hypothetical protein Q8M24_19000 [Pseudolabrys sp.]|nr:hypothetical protein [Pseudolabrys sp.]MDP2297535.1 hypothetical protein [Pseudolabrys sp.]
MRERKRKSIGPAADDLIHGIRRQEIEGDVFELWIVISRLMAKVVSPDRKPAAGGPGKRPRGRTS